MITFAVVMVVVALLVTTFWYVPLIRQGKAKPVPATFIIVVIAFWVAALSHLSLPGEVVKKVVENITLYVATVQSTVILAVIALTYTARGEWSVMFDRRQKFYLLATLTSLGYWFMYRDQPGVPYWTVQGMMVLGYVATFEKILVRKTAFDSIVQWGLISVASAFGSIPALASGSWYAVGNSARSLICSAATVALFLYYDRAIGWAGLKSEVEEVRIFYASSGLGSKAKAP